MSPHHSAILHSGGPTLLAYVVGLKGACVLLDLLFGVQIAYISLPICACHE